jgi:predicted RNase H-like nuclease (RuvC/YqgF family)
MILAEVVGAPPPDQRRRRAHTTGKDSRINDKVTQNTLIQHSGKIASLEQDLRLLTDHVERMKKTIKRIEEELTNIKRTSR